MFIQSEIPLGSVTDKTYAIVFITALGLSALVLCLQRIVSGDPIFPKGVVKIPRFRYHDYDPLPTHVQNGNGVGLPEHKDFTPEPLLGWRLRMAFLHSLVLLALLLVHTVILLNDGTTFLRIVFVPYWVRLSILQVLIEGCHIHIQPATLSSDPVSPSSLQLRLCPCYPPFNLSLPCGCHPTTLPEIPIIGCYSVAAVRLGI